ncbi:MAG: LEA type 2 family protein [Deltaproteobacteria bacterium]|nr:LEA type 2 family protein [Deltaproteobacteria bacterium]
MRSSNIFIIPPCPPFRKGGENHLALVFFLGLLVIAGLTGCGVGQLRQMARGEIQAPKVTYQGLKVYQPTAQGWPLGATLLLENPNPQALNLSGYDYQLWIEGKSVAQGTSQQPVNLPPLGQTVTELPIMVQLPAVLDLLPQFLPQFLGQQQQQTPLRKFHYQIAGSFRLASVLGGIIPIPFKFQGEASPREGLDFLKPYLR